MNVHQITYIHHTYKNIHVSDLQKLDGTKTYQFSICWDVILYIILCNKTIRDKQCYLKQSSVHPRKKSTTK